MAPTTIGTMTFDGDVAEVAQELASATNILKEDSPTTLFAFEELFLERSLLPGVVESFPQRIALIKVFSGLLKSRYHNTRPARDREILTRPSAQFVQDFEYALASLAEEHPSALLFFDHHRRLASYEASDALRHLLWGYLAGGLSLPY